MSAQLRGRRGNIERKRGQTLRVQQQAATIPPAPVAQMGWQIIPRAIQGQRVKIRLLTLEYKHAKIGHD